MSSKEIRFLLGVAMSVVTVILIFILIFSFLKKEEKTASIYRLIEQNGTVTLYSNDEVVSVYEDIITENLPVKDRKALKNGIEFDSLEGAERAAEDYDG